MPRYRFATLLLLLVGAGWANSAAAADLPTLTFEAPPEVEPGTPFTVVVKASDKAVLTVLLSLIEQAGTVHQWTATTGGGASNQARFTDLVLPRLAASAPATLVAVAPTAVGVATVTTMVNVRAPAGDPQRLVFLDPPPLCQVGALLPALRVQVVKASGEPVRTPVKVVVRAVPGPGTPGESPSWEATTVDGVAAFADIRIRQAGRGYVLLAALPEWLTVAPAASAVFDVVPVNGVASVPMTQRLGDFVTLGGARQMTSSGPTAWTPTGTAAEGEQPVVPTALATDRQAPPPRYGPWVGTWVGDRVVGHRTVLTLQWAPALLAPYAANLAQGQITDLGPTMANLVKLVETLRRVQPARDAAALRLAALVQRRDARLAQGIVKSRLDAEASLCIVGPNVAQAGQNTAYQVMVKSAPQAEGAVPELLAVEYRTLSSGTSADALGQLAWQTATGGATRSIVANASAGDGYLQVRVVRVGGVPTYRSLRLRALVSADYGTACAIVGLSANGTLGTADGEFAGLPEKLKSPAIPDGSMEQWAKIAPGRYLHLRLPGAVTGASTFELVDAAKPDKAVLLTGMPLLWTNSAAKIQIPADATWSWADPSQPVHLVQAKVTVPAGAAGAGTYTSPPFPVVDDTERQRLDAERKQADAAYRAASAEARMQLATLLAKDPALKDLASDVGAQAAQSPVVTIAPRLIERIQGLHDQFQQRADKQLVQLLLDARLTDTHGVAHSVPLAGYGEWSGSRPASKGLLTPQFQDELSMANAFQNLWQVGMPRLTADARADLRELPTLGQDILGKLKDEGGQLLAKAEKLVNALGDTAEAKAVKDKATAVQATLETLRTELQDLPTDPGGGDVTRVYQYSEAWVRFGQAALSIGNTLSAQVLALEEAAGNLLTTHSTLVQQGEKDAAAELKSGFAQQVRDVLAELKGLQTAKDLQQIADSFRNQQDVNDALVKLTPKAITRDADLDTSLDLAGPDVLPEWFTPHGRLEIRAQVLGPTARAMAVEVWRFRVQREGVYDQLSGTFNLVLPFSNPAGKTVQPTIGANYHWHLGTDDPSSWLNNFSIGPTLTLVDLNPNRKGRSFAAGISVGFQDRFNFGYGWELDHHVPFMFFGVNVANLKELLR